MMGGTTGEILGLDLNQRQQAETNNMMGSRVVIHSSWKRKTVARLARYCFLLIHACANLLSGTPNRNTDGNDLAMPITYPPKTCT